MSVRCWPCMTGGCSPSPTLHPWWDDEDVAHARLTGQPPPSGHCGCVFCGAPGSGPPRRDRRRDPRMKLDDGREVLCTLALPLPLRLAGALAAAIDVAAEEAGYTDVVMLTDGTNRIVARRAATNGEVGA